MQKVELIGEVAVSTDTKKVLVAKIVNGLFACLAKAFVKGEDVSIVGFGVFENVILKEKKVQHPKSGIMMLVPAQKAVKFRMSKALKVACNVVSK